MFRHDEYFHMSFDAFWNHCKRNTDDYEELSDIHYSINTDNYSKTAPRSLWRNVKIAGVESYWYGDVEEAFKAWCTDIEGKFSKMQTYIQGKSSYDDGQYDLDDDWDEEWNDICEHDTEHWQNFLKEFVKQQTRDYCRQLAKYGVIFLTPCSISFTSKQYRYLRHLYDYGNLDV